MLAKVHSAQKVGFGQNMKAARDASPAYFSNINITEVEGLAEELLCARDALTIDSIWDTTGKSKDKDGGRKKKVEFF